MCLDTLGVAAASAPVEAGRIARNTARRLYASGDPSFEAPMLFDGRRVSLAGAAYTAATQTDNLDAHDGYKPVKGHTGSRLSRRCLHWPSRPIRLAGGRCRLQREAQAGFLGPLGFLDMVGVGVARRNERQTQHHHHYRSPDPGRMGFAEQVDAPDHARQRHDISCLAGK